MADKARSIRPVVVVMLGGLLAVALAAGAGWSPAQPGSPHSGPAAPVGVDGASAQPDPGSGALRQITVARAVRYDLSAPLRSQPATISAGEQDADLYVERGVADHRGAPPAAAKDPVLQPDAAVSSSSVSAPLANFAGQGNLNGVLPPDTNGDVGPNHYVQWVNLSLAIYSKTGVLLYGPTNGNTLWSGFGGPCQADNDGDPIVLYDSLADRWMVSQFALPGGTSGYHQCIAVSQTPDPTGAWYRYDFLYSTTKMNDYPHFGVWPDGYYMSTNQFTGGASWGGQGVAVFERQKMLAGDPTARMVSFDLYGVDPNLGGMLPSDLDGPAPPAGAPNPFAEIDDNAWGYSPDQVQIWNFHVDWANTANSSFTKAVALPTAAFDSNMCNYGRSCIAQSGTTVKLDALSDRLMYRLQYRNFGDHQSLVVDHTVDVDGHDHAGLRWYELRNTGAGWSIFQQGTFAPDANQRWMGSAAMNGLGGIALGYSVSSATMYPSIRYTGRLATDPAGTLPQGEGTVINGTGAQTHSASRWGDYSMLAVDPVDDCTFWFTSEYLAKTGSAPWLTRVASFTLPDCAGGPTPTPTPTSGPTPTPTSAATPTPSPTSAPTATPTSAPTPTPTPTPTPAPTATPTPPAVTTQWVFPTANAAVTSGAGDNNGYETSPTSAYATDGIVATDAKSGTANSTSCTSAARDKHDFSGFNLAVPSTAAVQGIEVQLVASVNSNKNTPKLCVLLSADGGATWTSGKVSRGLKTIRSTFALGSTTDTWGRSWSASSLASGLRVRIVDLANSTARTFYLDSVAVRVTYR